MKGGSKRARKNGVSELSTREEEAKERSTRAVDKSIAAVIRAKAKVKRETEREGRGKKEKKKE